jgi:hypothetical protein
MLIRGGFYLIEVTSCCLPEGGEQQLEAGQLLFALSSLILSKPGIIQLVYRLQTQRGDFLSVGKFSQLTPLSKAKRANQIFHTALWNQL